MSRNGTNFYRKRNSQRYYSNKKRQRHYLNIPEKYMKLLDVNWSKPGVISNLVLQQTPLNKFNYSEKIDGIHTYLLIFEKRIYNVTDNKYEDDIYQMDIHNFEDMNFTGDCIIETEYYEGFYYIFDVYYLNGIDYSNKCLKERLNSITEYINELGPSFKLKKFHEITDLNELLEYIKNDKSPEGINIDGIVLQRIDKPYFQLQNEPNCYKFKPLHLNTVDFLLKFDDISNSFDLYLLGTYKQYYLNNMKKLPKVKDIYGINNNFPLIRKNAFLYDDQKVLIYFDSPFYPNLGKMILTNNWNKENYSLNQIIQINNLIRRMITNPKAYNNSIVELSLTNDKKWVPLRLRDDDKNLPNTYRVGLSNVSIMFDPIKPLNDIYFQKNLTMSEEKLVIIHKINQTFRKYVIEKYINPYGPNSSIIDLCGGRGADQFNLYSNGVSNFFVIDNDTTALKRYFDRTFYVNNLEYEPLMIKHLKRPKWINLNILKHKLDKNYEDIKKDLYSRYEFYKRKVNIVLMNYAIHYLCDDAEKIRKLCEFVKSVLFRDGIFIITYFDGDEIMKKMENKVAKIGPFNIEVIKEENDVTIAKMPLPTIKEGNDIYAEEPLVKNKTIKIFDEYFYKHDEFFVYDKCKKFIDNIPGFGEFIDYYRLIKVGIYYLQK